MTLTPFGRVLVFCIGVVVMSVSSAATDRWLGVKVLGSTSARVDHVILGMTKGAFLVWLMSVTILGG